MYTFIKLILINQILIRIPVDRLTLLCVLYDMLIESLLATDDNLVIILSLIWHRNIEIICGWDLLLVNAHIDLTCITLIVIFQI